MSKVKKDAKNLLESAPTIVGIASQAMVTRAMQLIMGADPFMGAALGALAGIPIRNAIEDFSERALSRREEARGGAVAVHAALKIKDRIDKGDVLRTDGFFTLETGNTRPPAEEILDAVLTTAKASHEERKLKYLSSLYANLCFVEEVSSAEANYMVKLTERLSYRQLSLLSVIYDRGPPRKDWRMPTIMSTNSDRQTYARGSSIYQEAFELIQVSLVDQVGALSIDAIASAASIDPAKLRLSEVGQVFCDMLEIYDLPKEDRREAIGALSQYHG